MPNKKLYTVTYLSAPPYTTQVKTPQAACRKAFRFWIKNKHIKRQPKSTIEGGFENVEVEIHDES